MAIKSIKLKMFFKKDQNYLYKQIWETHTLFNEGVAYYLKQLLLLRQVPTESSIDPKGDLLRLARTAQSSNGKSRIGTDEEILTTLRKLYEEIIPSAIGKSSNAQMLGRAFLSTLVDPKSKAGLGVAPRRTPKKDDEPDGNPILIELKTKYGLLPLFKSYSDFLGNWLKRGVCTTWDRDMFQQAIEKVCSWEAWNLRVKAEHEKLSLQFEAQLAEHFNPYPEWAQRLEQFEKERKIDLDLIALPSDRPYRVMKSGIRSWKALREHWRALKDKSTAILAEIIADFQNELRGEFGDPAVFHWLAHERNHFIWDCEEDHLSQYVKLNEALEKRDRAKQQAQFTLPDPIHHPLWARYDGPGGNLQWYAINRSGDGVTLSLVVLVREAGQVVEHAISVPLAWSLQWDRIQVREFKDVPPEVASQIARQKNEAKIQWVQWRDPGTAKFFYGKLGGAKIQFERRSLEKGRGYFDSYINVTINFIPAVTDELSKSFTLVKPDETSPWTIVDLKPEPFQAMPLSQESKKGIDGLSSGLRVMSVALRFKTLAICSVFKVTDSKAEYSIPIQGTSRFAVHERSFLLRLPGEKWSDSTSKKRMAIVQERQDLKRKLQKLSRILSLATKAPEDRKELIKVLRKTDFADEQALLDKIEKQLQAKQEEWQEYVMAIHRELEREFGKEIERWRKKYRRKSSELRNVCGLSMWWLEELTETRKLINSWSAHARKPQEIVRARSLTGVRKDAKAREVDLDQRLIRHINHIKDDRIKKGADQIVMAALGYVYKDKNARWEAKHEPCRIILFADIKDYKMDRAQSRKENARLMAWAHRMVPKNVAHQGEVYGLLAGIVRTTNTYQTAARTGSPSVRMLQIKEEYFDQVWFARGLLMELAKRHKITKPERKAILDLSRAERRAKLMQLAQPGQWIPWPSDTIITQSAGKVVKSGALVNSVQLLQRLFWTRQLVISKLWCIGSDEIGYAPVSIGKRVEVSLGYGKLTRAQGNGYTWQELTKRQWKAIAGKDTIESSDEEEEENTRVEAINAEMNKKMFFRDPTGEFLPADEWYPAELFWAQIEKALDGLLK
jgi:hypothetical protein